MLQQQLAGWLASTTVRLLLINLRYSKRGACRDIWNKQIEQNATFLKKSDISQNKQSSETTKKSHCASGKLTGVDFCFFGSHGTQPSLQEMLSNSSSMQKKKAASVW